MAEPPSHRATGTGIALQSVALSVIKESAIRLEAAQKTRHACEINLILDIAEIEMAEMQDEYPVVLPLKEEHMNRPDTGSLRPEVSTWIAQHCDGDYCPARIITHGLAVIGFEDADDAEAFKARWC